MKLASIFAHYAPSSAQDLASVALVCLTERVTLARTELVDDNIGAYLNAWITHTLRDAVQRVPIVHTLSSAKRGQRATFEVFGESVTNDPNFIELLDSIRSACKTEQERKVIDLKSQGATNKDVANLLNVSTQYVGRICKAVWERFLEDK